MRSLAFKYNLDPALRRISTRALARAAGAQAEKEYEAFFKLFSKLVHPSSFLVNGTAKNAYGFPIRNALVIHLKLYAHDMLTRIRESLGVPDDVLHQNGLGSPGDWDTKL